MQNPFYDLWDSYNGSKLAMITLVCGCASGVLYFSLLTFLIGKVFFNFHKKKSQLPGMNKMRRAFYEVSASRTIIIFIYRFIVKIGAKNNCFILGNHL